MSGSTPIAIVAAGLLSLVPLIEPSAAATTRRHVQCYALTVGVGGLLGSNLIPTNAIVTNNGAAAIPSGTELTVNYQGHQTSYVTRSALASGANVTFQITTSADSGPCDAYYAETAAPPKSKFGAVVKLPKGTLQVSP